MRSQRTTATVFTYSLYSNWTEEDEAWTNGIIQMTSEDVDSIRPSALIHVTGPSSAVNSRRCSRSVKRPAWRVSLEPSTGCRLKSFRRPLLVKKWSPVSQGTVATGPLSLLPSAGWEMSTGWRAAAGLCAWEDNRRSSVTDSAVH